MIIVRNTVYQRFEYRGSGGTAMNITVGDYLTTFIMVFHIRSWTKLELNTVYRFILAPVKYSDSKPLDK